MVTPLSAQPMPRLGQRIAIDLAWQLPLALLSFCFYRMNRLVISRLYRRFQARLGSRATTWRLLNRATLAMPISLPVLMTTGPRWNTHAVIGTLGPLAVSKTLSVRTSTCRKSAASWTAVIYRFPDFLTVTQFSSLTADPLSDWSGLDLSAGRYILGIRYYGLCDEPLMPEVQVDDVLVTEPLLAPANVNEVYADLESRTNLYYRALHYYIYPLLRLRSFFPAAFVRSEFLPVGDPDTIFRFDLVASRHYLNVRVSLELLDAHRVFLTAYNRASLPVLSEEITTTNWSSPAFRHDGFYLFRIRPLRAGLDPIEAKDFNVSLEPS
jgi:hypothetical protein